MRPDLAAVIARAAHAGPEPSEAAMEEAVHWNAHERFTRERHEMLALALEYHIVAHEIVTLALALDAFAARALDAEAAALRDALKSWSFDDKQWHTHTWHDREDWIARHECVRALHRAAFARPSGGGETS